MDDRRADSPDSLGGKGVDPDLAAAARGGNARGQLAESIRVSIGTPILVCAILAMLFGVRGWRRRLVATVLLVIAYVSIAPAAMSAVTAYRNHRMAAMGIHGIWLGTGWSKTQPVWHVPYIGLGYLPNRYHLYYRNDIRRS